MAANTSPSRMGSDTKGTATANFRESYASSTLSPKIGAVTHPGAITHLSKPDLTTFREAIGAPPIFYESVDPKNPTPSTKLSRKVPDGLYKSVLGAERSANITYFFIMLVFNCCIVLQLLLGATLTALTAVGSVKADKIGISTTVIAAVNTVDAGIIALFHNAGFPGRLRNNVSEYSKVVEWLEFVMHSGIIDKGMTVDDVIQEAFDKYNAARATVEKNQPDTYAGPQKASGNRQPSAPTDISPEL